MKLQRQFPFFLLLASQALCAQVISEAPYIEVQTTAERDLTPNEIYIQIHLEENPEAKRAVKISEQENRLFKLIKTLKIPSENVVLNQSESKLANINFWGKKELIDKKIYTVKVYDVTTVSKVYEELNRIPVSTAFISKTQVLNQDSIMKVLRQEALIKAQAQAKDMVTAIGQNVGKPLIIREQPEYYGGPVMLKGLYSSEATEDPEESPSSDGLPEILFAPIKFKTGVYVKFEIK
jgi:uncharacterized protein YggE